ncbi:MAG TPA: CotH kinase family protein [Sedimentisphaerales bacterium]|nr:CotH kinase family protein [Sedimentisphaerales bacterium]HRS12971.1 CotH kinase family protein [Sedimentisphaerales bacterium]HRV49604.1 CotH kinase family protein [Sedimentisphaerales bacterium]
MTHRCFLAAVLLVLGLAAILPAQNLVRISEFMAVNDRGLEDEDRNEEDWIEIHNSEAGDVNLEGWFLTDDPENLTKWTFPAVTLGAGEYLVVFASGKDRRDPAGQLHTNFRLSGDGEYLALVGPDGVTVTSEFSPAYPIQAPDISYGLANATSEEVLLPQGSPARALVPLDNSLEGGPRFGNKRLWTLEGLDDSAWQSGTTGVGHGYGPMIGTDVSAMIGVNETVYIRIPFVVDNLAELRGLTLRVWFDDGIIAYINGHEVGRYNAPAAGTETWNSGAPDSWPRNRIPDAVDFDVPWLDVLHEGTNLLAIQGLNHGLSSPDLLVMPQLLARVVEVHPPLHYFPTPTPGLPNEAGVEAIGPVITEAAHFPATPTIRQSLRITARIAQSCDPVVSTTLHYRVMFGPEISAPLVDDGTGHDITGGDGIFTALISARAFRAGEMIRWYITATDAAGRVSRWPRFADPQNSPQYCGTVAADHSLTTALPVLCWFIENPQAADTDQGTRCALFYDGQFYDNVRVYLHGQSSRGFPKKSYNIDLHPGYNFKWAEGQPRADDINLMTTYPDKAQMRNILAYETYRDADCAYHWVIPVRVQQNGQFWGTAHLMENGDADWLVRMGLNSQGALYKMYNSFSSPGDVTYGAEKKTRKDEDNDDLLALYNGLSASGESPQRYLYDHVDVAQVVNFLAARAVTGDTDCCHKNYYLYCDTGRTNLWQMWPWDVDLSFGRRWISHLTYWDQNLIANTPLFIGSGNRLPQAIFDIPETRQMYLRRVRTLMDELLKPPGTPPEELHYEPRIDELAALLAPDAALDADRWGSDSWGNGSTAPCCPQSLPEAVAELKDSYLPERRRQLYERLVPGARELPDSQPAETIISFGAVDNAPVSGNPDEGCIQLLNANRYAVDISGWTLSDGANRQPPLFTFRGGTVIPADGALYVAVSRIGFDLRRQWPTKGRALFVVGDCTRSLPASGTILELIDRRGRPVDRIVMP